MSRFEILDLLEDLEIDTLFEGGRGLLAGGAVMAVFGIFMLILLICIGMYVFNSLMLYYLAKKRGVENAWLAWIPLGNEYLLGRIGGHMTLLGKWRIEKPELILLLAPLALWLVGWILGVFALVPFIGVLFAAIATVVSFVGNLALLAFRLCVLYRIFTAYVPKNTALVYTLVSIISVTTPFFIATILKKDAISAGYDFTF